MKKDLKISIFFHFFSTARERLAYTMFFWKGNVPLSRGLAKATHSPFFHIGYSIDTPSILHRWSIASMEELWSIDGELMEYLRRNEVAKRDFQTQRRKAAEFFLRTQNSRDLSQTHWPRGSKETEVFRISCFRHLEKPIKTIENKVKHFY